MKDGTFKRYSNVKLHCTFKDTEVIGNALTGHREKQLECKRCDAQTAHITLDEDVQVLKKRLNHFVHQKVLVLELIRIIAFYILQS